MPDVPDKVRSMAAAMLEQAQMSEGETRRRADLAADAGYWSSLAPGSSLASAPRVPQHRLSVADLEAARRQFAADGYFQTPPIIDVSALTGLNASIDAVVAAGWPPVFAWVYDEFWALARLPAIVDILASQIGEGHAQIPHIWTHVVPATVGSSGWVPHFDGPTGGRASIWIALTDATLSNGCMHLVSRRHLPSGFDAEPFESSQVSLVDAFRALHGVRALPAAAGSVLGWTFDVLHWGGPCLSADRPRRAISLEFIAASQPPNRDELPLVPISGSLPSLRERLRMIATAVAGYEKFEPGLVRYRGIARRLTV